MNAKQKATKGQKNVEIIDPAIEKKYRKTHHNSLTSSRKTGRPAGINANNRLCDSAAILKAKEYSEVGCPGYIIAAALGISVQTASEWCGKYPEFKAALVEGRAAYCAARMRDYNDLCTGKADPFKYPEVRRKAIERSLDRLFPEHAQQNIDLEPVVKQTAPESDAQKSYRMLREMMDGNLTSATKGECETDK